MNAQEQKQLVIGNALLWAAAVATPVVVQIVLDLFDRESAGSVAITSMFVIFVLSGIANRRLGVRLKKVAEST